MTHETSRTDADYRERAFAAAREGLQGVGLVGKEGGLDGPFGVHFVEGPFETVIGAVIDGAAPVLREQFAAQFLQEAVGRGHVRRGHECAHAGVGCPSVAIVETLVGLVGMERVSELLAALDKPSRG